MIAIKEDKVANFVPVVHTGSGDIYRLHQDDLSKIGTNTKVAVYESQSAGYQAPCTEYPKGKYTARVRYFVAAYLTQPQLNP